MSPGRPDAPVAPLSPFSPRAPDAPVIPLRPDNPTMCHNLLSSGNEISDDLTAEMIATKKKHLKCVHNTQWHVVAFSS